MKQIRVLGYSTLASAAILLSGCATGEKQPHVYTGPGGVTYHQDNDIQGVWLADGFDFNGYDTLYVAEPSASAESRSDEEKRVLATAQRNLRQQLVNALSDIHVFQHVSASTNDIPAGAKVLKLENDIYHHEKGGGGARYFAGFAGAGQPVIKVAGTMLAAEQPVFRYDMTRSGEGADARMAGVFMSDEDIQTRDIKDLTVDLASFVQRTAHPAAASATAGVPSTGAK
jgi:hypothetical protein